jgi:hypothetical protein
MISFNVGIKTLYKVIGVNPVTGQERDLSAWSENTILTSGRNEMANRDWFTYVQLGTDNTIPAATQTSLLGYVAGTNTIIEDVKGTNSSPYYGYRRKRFRFAAGVGLGGENLNEVAIGWAGTTGANIAARALLVDIDGNQTTVTPLTDELVDVIVEVRYYPPTTDVTGTVTLDGVTYNYIVRAAEVLNTSAWADSIGSQIESTAGFNSDWAAFDGDLGTVEQSPNGLSVPSNNSNDYTQAYQNNSYQIKFGMIVGPGTADVDGWYVTTGKLCRSIRVTTTAGWYQIQFDSQSNPGFGVPKDDTRTFTLQLVLGWQEQVIT